MPRGGQRVGAGRHKKPKPMVVRSFTVTWDQSALLDALEEGKRSALVRRALDYILTRSDASEETPGATGGAEAQAANDA